MGNNQNASPIKLNSNIMLKSKFEKDHYGYLSPDILPDYYSDVRIRGSLTKLQQKQFEKRLFYATKVIDD